MSRINFVFPRTAALAFCAFLFFGTPVSGLELEVVGDRVSPLEDSGSGVAIIGVRREYADYMNKIIRHVEVVDGDLIAESEIGPRSVWVGVDLGTGEWTVHSPGGFAQRKSYQGDLSGGVLKSLDRLELPGNELDIVVVRRTNRGARVWHGRVHDGGAGDDGDADGWLIAKNQKLRRVDQGEGNLARFKDGDVVIGFDAGSLEYFAIEIGASEVGAVEVGTSEEGGAQ